MVHVTFEYDDSGSKTVEVPWSSDQVDGEVQRLLSVPGNEFEVGGQRIPKNFRGYTFD